MDPEETPPVAARPPPCDCSCLCCGPNSAPSAAWHRSLKRKLDQMEAEVAAAPMNARRDRLIAGKGEGDEEVARVEIENEAVALREALGSHQQSIQELYTEFGGGEERVSEDGGRGDVDDPPAPAEAAEWREGEGRGSHDLLLPPPRIGEDVVVCGSVDRRRSVEGMRAGGERRQRLPGGITGRRRDRDKGLNRDRDKGLNGCIKNLP